MKEGDFSIRMAGLADLDELVPLFDAYRVFYGQASDMERARRFLRARLSRDESVIFIAMLRGRALGFIQMYPAFSSVSTSRVWILNDLYVDQGRRRHGTATRLMQFSANWARDKGATRLILETAADNGPAKSLYESLGWIREEAFDRYQLFL